MHFLNVLVYLMYPLFSDWNILSVIYNKKLSNYTFLVKNQIQKTVMMLMMTMMMMKMKMKMMEFYLVEKMMKKR